MCLDHYNINILLQSILPLFTLLSCFTLRPSYQNSCIWGMNMNIYFQRICPLVMGFLFIYTTLIRFIFVSRLCILNYWITYVYDLYICSNEVDIFIIFSLFRFMNFTCFYCKYYLNQFLWVLKESFVLKLNFYVLNILSRNRYIIISRSWI